jgi:hypothetical protein
MLDAGADPSAMSEYGESPLRVASKNGRFEVVRMLLDAGADGGQLGWDELFFAVAFGTALELEAALAGAPDTAARDYWERTPYLLALQVGSVEKATVLLAAGADRGARGRCGETPLAHAIRGDHVDVLRWLLEAGEDIEGANDSGDTPLIAAALWSARRCVTALVDAGADIFASNDIPHRAIDMTGDPAIVAALVEAGEDVNKLDGEVRAAMTGLAASPIPEVTEAEYSRGGHPRFGTANSELADEPFWQMMIRTRESAYGARERFEAGRRSRAPVWSIQRFGCSFTPLDDGRFIEIAGEHEDHYDPDFFIYNDVFVHDGRGDCAIYLCPPEVFPPTDFHTATLVGERIWIIGNLGYRENRRPGETPVFTLDIHSLAIAAVETSGELPGWISDHRADLIGDEIAIRGGKLIGADPGGGETYTDNETSYALALDTLTWRRVGNT